MGLANGVHHAAFCTRDLKTQISFFTDVLGMELVALYWMHGVEGAMHAFLRLDDDSSIAFVQMPQVAEIKAELGVTHAGNAGDPVAGGALQHLAFNIKDPDDLLAMRDRIRARGVQVHGPVDHGFCQSIYLAGPEGIQLEFSISEKAIAAESWIDPEVVELCGINRDELARFKKPRSFSGQGGAIKQPPFDPNRPHQIYAPPLDEWVKDASDQEFTKTFSHAEPPVSNRTGSN
jgi:catechol 2,3-dioxygenase-like lactoylglutathione lyase family enzyme